MRNIATLPIGEKITLTDDEVLDVKFLQVLQTKPSKERDKRGNEIVPQDYARMRYGSIAFTIATPEDVAIVSNAEQRDDIYSMTLEVSEILEPRLDETSGNPVLDENQQPVIDRRVGLTFVSLQTYTSKIARDTKRVASQGAVQAERVKWGLDKPVNVDDVAARVAEQLKAQGIGAAAPAVE